jgi:hypothetical protein
MPERARLSAAAPGTVPRMAASPVPELVRPSEDPLLHDDSVGGGIAGSSAGDRCGSCPPASTRSDEDWERSTT